jgi:hypothetical protein
LLADGIDNGGAAFRLCGKDGLAERQRLRSDCGKTR